MILRQLKPVLSYLQGIIHKRFEIKNLESQIILACLHCSQKVKKIPAEFELVRDNLTSSKISLALRWRIADLEVPTKYVYSLNVKVNCYPNWRYIYWPWAASCSGSWSILTFAESLVTPMSTRASWASGSGKIGILAYPVTAETANIKYCWNRKHKVLLGKNVTTDKVRLWFAKRTDR